MAGDDSQAAHNPSKDSRSCPVQAAAFELTSILNHRVVDDAHALRLHEVNDVLNANLVWQCIHTLCTTCIVVVLLPLLSKQQLQ
eukprot:scaffold65608_cov71-Phaeocystis_antarctica.AAC.9